MSKISIIIRCYNEKKTIEKIIDKILIQKEYEKEIIVVDDFSTDGTRSILENNLKDKIFNLFFNRIRVTLEFTYILNKGKIVPHTDDTNKLLSFSLFFPKYQTAEKTKKNKDLYEKEKNIGTVIWKSNYKS